MNDLKGAAKVGGYFTIEHFRDGKLIGKETTHNLLTNQGLNHVLDVVLHGTTPVSPWYIAIFEGNYTPTSGDTAANFTANATESTAYDEATRVEYTEAAASSQSTTNSASKATFTINATKTIYGAALMSASAKSATTGTCLAVTRFTTSRAVIAADVLQVTYTISAASA